MPNPLIRASVWPRSFSLIQRKLIPSQPMGHSPWRSNESNALYDVDGVVRGASVDDDVVEKEGSRLAEDAPMVSARNCPWL